MALELLSLLCTFENSIECSILLFDSDSFRIAKTSIGRADFRKFFTPWGGGLPLGGGATNPSPLARLYSHKTQEDSSTLHKTWNVGMKIFPRCLLLEFRKASLL